MRILMWSVLQRLPRQWDIRDMAADDAARYVSVQIALSAVDRLLSITVTDRRRRRWWLHSSLWWVAGVILDVGAVWFLRWAGRLHQQSVCTAVNEGLNPGSRQPRWQRAVFAVEWLLLHEVWPTALLAGGYGAWLGKRIRRNRASAETGLGQAPVTDMPVDAGGWLAGWDVRRMAGRQVVAHIAMRVALGTVQSVLRSTRFGRRLRWYHTVRTAAWMTLLYSGMIWMVRWADRFGRMQQENPNWASDWRRKAEEWYLASLERQVNGGQIPQETLDAVRRQIASRRAEEDRERPV